MNRVSSFRTLALSSINTIADVVSYLTDGFCKAILTIKETLLPNSLYLHEGQKRRQVNCCGNRKELLINRNVVFILFSAK